MPVRCGAPYKRRPHFHTRPLQAAPASRLTVSKSWPAAGHLSRSMPPPSTVFADSIDVAHRANPGYPSGWEEARAADRQ